MRVCETGCIGYGWLAFGFLLLGLDALTPWLPQTAALMTRTTLGHTGRPLSAGPGTTTIYGLVTLAAVLRLLAPLGGAQYVPLLWFAGLARSSAFGLFALLYLRPLAAPRVGRDAVLRPI